MLPVVRAKLLGGAHVAVCVSGLGREGLRYCSGARCVRALLALWRQVKTIAKETKVCLIVGYCGLTASRAAPRRP
jgi:hypothetical protein